MWLGTDIGLYESQNGGSDWNPTPFNESVIDLAQDPLCPDTLFVAAFTSGVFQVWSGGSAWQLLGQEGLYSTEIEFDPLDAMTIYVAGWWAGGIRWSEDRGHTWQTYEPHQVCDKDILGLKTFVTEEQTTGLYACSGHVGFQRFDAETATWQPSAEGIAELSILDLASCRNDPRVLYACADCMSPLRSDDGGLTWTMFPGQQAWGHDLDTDGLSPALAVHPTDPDVAYFSTCSPCCLFKTSDGGRSWEHLAEGLDPLSDGDKIRGIAIDPQQPQVVYASSTRGVFKSTDGGAHWEQKIDGMVNTMLWDIAIDPTDTNVLYATGMVPSYVYKSVDGAEHWFNASSGIGGPIEGTSIVIHPDDPGVLYVALCGLEANPTMGTVYRSVDAAATWQEMRDGLPGCIMRPKLRIAAHQGLVWLATPSQGTGISVCHTTATTWRDAGNGLPSNWVMSLEVAPEDSGALVVVGIRAGSCWHLWGSLAGIDDAMTPAPGMWDDLSASDAPQPTWLNVSPNPVPTSGATLAWDMPAATDLVVEIVDVMGRRVRTLSSGQVPRGGGKLSWDGTDDKGRFLTSGVYYCNVRTQFGDAVRRIVLSR
jgi:photosystem II stability/assembly factor-like uncharacterized protein